MTRTNKAKQAFVFQKDGVDYLKLCVDITLYFVGPPSAHAEGILDFYAQALKILKPEIVQYETGNMSKPKKIKADTFDMLPLWISNPKAKQDMMQLRLDNSTGPDSAADRAFQFIYFEDDGAGAVRLVLPASSVEKSATSLADLARNLPRKLKFSSGLGGYSLNWNKNGDFDYDAKNDIYPISRRHPGIDVPDLDGDLPSITKGIKCINWLTFLDDVYVKRLGGLEGVRKALDEQVVCEPLSHGIVIQAGPRPEMGDVNQRLTLPLYHSVGKAVAKVRAKEHFPFIPSAKNPEDATDKWLARFDS
ncbi:MAG TPA: type VI immunity family protein [Candidatus Paceibacterota bacterium]|nr:type VI immunity family protein [Candidatus Paceibacterota bacterium]